MNTALFAQVIADARAQAGLHQPGLEAGRAFVIQVEPDLAARERVNVGVGVITPEGKRLARLLEDYGRVEAMYGRDTAELIEALADIARAAVLSGDVIGTSSISFTQAQPFFGLAPEQYLDQLFARMVPAAAPRREHTDTEDARGTDKVLRAVGDAIKLRLPDRASEIIANTAWTMVETARGARGVCVPLQPPGGAGALESADYSVAIAERKLMRALLDVETAAEAKKLERLGLFIARPHRVRKEAELKAIDTAIDYVACRAPRKCRVEIETDTTLLAESIIDWAELSGQFHKYGHVYS